MTELYKKYTLNWLTVSNTLSASFWYTWELKYRILELSINYTKLLSL